MANWLTRLIKPSAARVAEGEFRPGPYALSDGWLPASVGKTWNWWQSGHSLQPYAGCTSMVEACVSAYSQTVAMCPADHWRTNADGSRERVTNSALSRLMKRPNDYLSSSDFFLNLTRTLFEKGQAFGYATRNSRNEISEVHLMRNGQPILAMDGSIFYALSGNDVAERRFDFSTPIPARNVLHVRLHTPRNPLIGESPILAAALNIASSGAALNQSIAFHLNQSRPSYILETDQKPNAQQIAELRQLWNEQTQGENAGGTPILTWGLKARPVTVNARDGQLAEMLKLDDQAIALAFRMPLQVLGIAAGGTVNTTEALMQQWIASGLGFTLNHIEEAFGVLFDLKGQPDEYLELDTEALLRSAYKDRIEALVLATTGGLMSADEARRKEGLPPVAGGHGAMPRVQQQVVPLSYGSDLQPPSPQPAPLPAPADEEATPERMAEAAANLRAVLNENVRSATVH